MAQGRGRPSKLTPETQAKICAAIRGGNYRQVAAQWAGINRVQFSRWMKRGEKETSGIHRDFRNAVLEAERAAEIAAVALVMKAASEDPKHAQWWLERKCHTRWGRKDRTEITGRNNGPVMMQIIEQIVTSSDDSDSKPEGDKASSSPGKLPPK